MLSKDAKNELLPLILKMEKILIQDRFIDKKRGDCMICGKAGKEAKRMGYEKGITFAEIGMPNHVILCTNHQIGWTRTSDAKIFNSWFEPTFKICPEEIKLHFALWLSVHLNKRSTVEA